MAAFTSALIALGTAASVAGAAVSAYGQNKALDAQKEAEGVRRNSMMIDAQRRKREVIRQGQIVRSQNIAATAASGANGPGSSASPGNYGGVMGRTYSNLEGINTQTAIGNAMFDINARVTDAYGISAMGGTISSIGGGLSSMGGQFQQSSQALSRVGAVGGTTGNTQGVSYNSDPWGNVRSQF